MADPYVVANYWSLFYTVEPWTYPPTYGAAATSKPKVWTSQFGEGYEQRTGEGLHALNRKWSLEFADRNPTDADAMEAFLVALNGIQHFTWTPPSGAVGQWVCREWRRAAVGYNNWTISAEFDEVFE